MDTSYSLLQQLSSRPTPMSEYPSDETRRDFTLATFGIQLAEQQALARILALSSVRTKRYSIRASGENRPADIYIVDIDRSEAVTAWRKERKSYIGVPSVSIVVAKNALPYDYYLRRPLMASRLLRLLDTAVERELANSPQSPSNPKDQAVTTVTAKSMSSYRALVVDDSLVVRKQIGLALQHEGITVDLADSGSMALDLVSHQAYNIVFLDIVMPGMDGYSVCRQIKHDPDHKHIPVVMLTGKSSPFNKVKGKLAGCDTYLTKPVELTLFKETVHKYLLPRTASN